MGVTLTLVGLVIYLAYKKYAHIAEDKKMDAPVDLPQSIAFHKFYLDEIYDAVVTRNLNMFSGFVGKWIDDGVFSNSLSFTGRSVRELGLAARKVQTGNVGSYFFAMVIAMCVILVYFIIQ